MPSQTFTALLVEETADRRVDQVLVGEPLDERLVAAADLGAPRRHLRALIPREQHRQRVEGVDVLEPRLQPCEGVGHAAERTTVGGGRRAPLGGGAGATL